jgi:putative DNA primase/helicase
MGHGRNIRYVVDMGRWIVWDDTRWRIDEGEIEIMRCAKDTGRSIYAEAQAEEDTSRHKGLAAWARQSESAWRIEAMIKLARSEPEITLYTKALNADRMLLGVQNGTLDLRTGQLRKPKREDYITKQASVTFDTNAQCARWRQFLEEITGGDEDLIRFLQRMAGYALTGDITEQCLFVLHGLGANGKGVFTSTLERLAGDYGCTTMAEILMAQKYRNIPLPELARLVGSRFVLAPESEDGAQLAEGVVKQLTGEDKIVACHKYRDPFEFQPQFKVWLVTNHEPIIKGDDHAIWRRIRLVPFKVTIPEDRQDKKLKGALLEELPGILNWAIEGCLAWQHEGLRPPPRVLKATEAYRSDMDILGDWIAQWCITGPEVADKSTPTEHLYASYEQWAKDCGQRYPMTQYTLELPRFRGQFNAWGASVILRPV